MPLAAHGGDIYGAARRLGVSPHQILDFSASINPLGLSSKAARRIVRELPVICHYPDRQQRELRALVASRQNIGPECIVFGNGATQLLYVVARYIAPRNVMLVVPGFSENHAALASVQSHVIEFRLRPESRFRFDMEVFIDQLRKTKPDCVFLTNPNNPTGSAIPYNDLVRVAELCSKSRSYFVVDESFIDFTREPSLSRLIERSRFLIVIHSLTKFLALPGLRIGYLAAHRAVARRIAFAVEPWSVNTLALAAAAESIKDHSYQRRSLALVAKEREYLLGGLEKFDWLEAYSSQVNFLLVRLKPRKLRGDVLRHELEKLHILIRDSKGFGGLGPQFFRVAVRTHNENHRLLDALRVVGEQIVSLGEG
jgi:threonine-phosphate decarboxylase